MKMASKSMNINSMLAIIFSTCNHRFLRISPSNSDTEFKTQCALPRLTHRKMKYLTMLPIILNRICGRKLARLNFLHENIQENFRTQQILEDQISVFVIYRTQAVFLCVDSDVMIFKMPSLSDSDSSWSRCNNNLIYRSTSLSLIFPLIQLVLFNVCGSWGKKILISTVYSETYSLL